MLRLLSCISYRQVYWSRKRERECGLAIFYVEALKRREERERDYGEVHNRNFVTSSTKYNKDKVPVAVATLLVVNHVNIVVLWPFVLCCVYAYGEVTDLDKYLNILKVWITVGILCMNMKLL